MSKPKSKANRRKPSTAAKSWGGVEMRAVVNEIPAPQIDWEKFIWAKAQVGRELVATLLKRIDASLKSLIPMLSALNDDATVRASFALEGMVMMATADSNAKTATELAIALANNFGLAKDATAQCIVLSSLEKLNAVKLLDDKNGKLLRCLEKCLYLDEPVFSQALSVLRSFRPFFDTFKTFSVLNAALSNDDKRKRALIYGGMFEHLPAHEIRRGKLLEHLKEFEDMPEMYSLFCQQFAEEGLFSLLDILLDALKGRKGSLISPAIARKCIGKLLMLCFPDDDSEYGDVSDGDEFDDKELDDDEFDDENLDDDDFDAVDDFDEDDFDDHCCDDHCCDDHEISDLVDEVFKSSDVDYYEKIVARRFAECEPKEPALVGLLTIFGETDDTFDILWECILEGDFILRKTALKFFEKGFRHTGRTEGILAKAQGITDEEIKADLVRMLGRRQDMAARPFVLSCILDKSSLVREAALAAAEQLEGKNLTSNRLSALLLARS